MVLVCRTGRVDLHLGRVLVQLCDWLREVPVLQLSIHQGLTRVDLLTSRLWCRWSLWQRLRILGWYWDRCRLGRYVVVHRLDRWPIGGIGIGGVRIGEVSPVQNLAVAATTGNSE